MSQRTTRARVLGKLLESLGTAEKGSRELDIVIAYVLGDTSSEAGQMIQLLVGEGYSWDIVSELLDEELAPYTRSLDAAIPGEQIVLSLYSPRRRRWAAVQGSEEDAMPGAEALSWAATECLARRRAALRTLFGRHAREAAGEAAAAPRRAREAAAPPAAAPAPAAPPPAQAAPSLAQAAPSPAPAAAPPPAPEEKIAAEEWKILF